MDSERPGSVVVGAVALGALAGVVAAAVLTFTAEPAIADAIRIEDARSAPTADHAKPVVSRGVQKGVGLFGAYVLAGAAFGLLFAAGFVGARRGRPDPFRRAAVVGTVLAGALTVSPWLKYPPNPPAVGDPATLARRQTLYVSLLVLSVLVLVGATYLSRRVRQAGWSEPTRVVCVAAAILLPLVVAYALLPAAPDPVNAPATLVWRFRLASLGGNLTLWTVLTLGFGLLATPRRMPEPKLSAAGTVR